MKEERLVKAFDAVEPDDEALARMWAKIEAAYDAEAEAAGAAGAAGAGVALKAVEGGESSETAGQSGNSFTVTAGGQAPAKRMRRNRSARWIPAVAAVLVVAVGVGIVLGNGVGTKAERAFAPDLAEPQITEASGTVPSKDYEMDSYSAAPVPEPAPNAPASASEVADLDGTGNGTLTMLEGEDGRRFSARTLILAVEDGVTRADIEALCAKYDLGVKYDWSDTSMFVVELSHDATLEEMTQLFAALSAEQGIHSVEYDYEVVAF